MDMYAGGCDYLRADSGIFVRAMARIECDDDAVAATLLPAVHPVRQAARRFCDGASIDPVRPYAARSAPATRAKLQYCVKTVLQLRPGTRFDLRCDFGTEF